MLELGMLSKKGLINKYPEVHPRSYAGHQVGATRPALEVLGFFFPPSGPSIRQGKTKDRMCHPINKTLDRAIPQVGALGKE
jgi:hypothetical protein